MTWGPFNWLIVAIGVPDQTYTYDTRYLRSLRHMTMEAFPKEIHYRNLMSIARGGRGSMRPTLEDLHGSTVREKPRVSSFFYKLYTYH